ncbi:lipid-A-disaccharide synthase [Basilea psittacipulmonis]|uniref:Lipid-A-disaccharide synthase n=1 Tax=Basilea psittacipulmonis DSM 24701 TaxID=1072685 RepID=A0A077DGQ4_9BURK|nr:lipid-A-disaccharide synthase [Basilea psittacipulmonis]AIL32642.1 lipid-A-disaccharide synthase [Basilea psittacipulmonis DSM 24701]
MKKIGIVAGEPSGDLIASRLMQSMNAQYIGIGGPHMQKEGLDSLYNMDVLSVFGYVDALKSLPKLIHTYYGLKDQLLKSQLDVFVGIDAPDFNLRLEHALKQKGIPTVHYVSPSIWAWRYERIHKIREAVSHMLVLFPFEVAIYEKEGIPVTFVGHPLASQIPANPDPLISRERLGIAKDKPVLAILPGSRQTEIELLAPRFLETAQKLQQEHPDICFIVPLVNEKRAKQFKAILKNYPLKNLFLFQEPVSNWPIAWDVMQACDAALVASGTACLELALFQKPMVISYVLSPLMKTIMKWKSGQDKPNIPWVGLPNILLSEFAVPELLQDQATVANLYQACIEALFDTSHRDVVKKKFQTIHQMLHQDTAKLASEAIARLA